MPSFQEKLSENAILVNFQMGKILDELKPLDSKNLQKSDKKIVNKTFENKVNIKINGKVNAKINKEIVGTTSNDHKNQENESQRLVEATNYAIFSGGKRIRPFLLLQTLEMLLEQEYQSKKSLLQKDKIKNRGKKPASHLSLKGKTTKAENQINEENFEQNFQTTKQNVLKIGLNIACALEFIHTYSLIHDDLPAMDDDDLRRGKPTCHKKFDEATAILAGDALLTFAFEILSDENLFDSNLANLTSKNQKIDNKTKNLTQNWQNNFSKTQLQIINLVAKAIGFNGMAGGQMLDLQSKNWESDLEDQNLEILKTKTQKLKNKEQFLNNEKPQSLKNEKIEQILHLHNLKTGKLLICAVQIAIILAKNFAVKINPETEKNLLEYATNIGLAFQIKDDILDSFLEKQSLEALKTLKKQGLKKDELQKESLKNNENQQKAKLKNKNQKLKKNKSRKDNFEKTQIDLETKQIKEELPDRSLTDQSLDSKNLVDQNLIINQKTKTQAINIVDLLGLKQSNLKLEKLKQKSINCLRVFGDNANSLRDLSLFMIERDS